MRNRLALNASKLLSAFCLVALVSCGCPDEQVSTSIGEFGSRDAALHAAIPKLSDAIRKCPHVKTYRIMFEAPGLDRVGRHALLYYRRDGPKGDIGYEDDVFSGISTGFGPYEIDDAVVHAIAEKGGSLQDFAEKDRRQK